MDFVPEWFELLKNAGVIDRLLEAYPKLNASRDSYIKLVDWIIDYKQTPFLLRQ